MLLHPLCPCGNEKPYVDCCEPFLTGNALAPTAEALMRSRYTAYRNGNVDYLIATRHAKHRQAGDRATLLQTMQTTCWVGLTILKTQKGQATDKRGVVEFVALYRTLQHQTTQTQTTQNRIIQIPNGQAADLQKENPVHQLHERSRFIQESGQWFYVDGDLLPPVKRTLF